MLQKLLKNPVIGYITSRYATYAIQFINSMLIAIYLGPVYLGIWGFINLVIQYLSQLNFGIAHAVNTIASIKKHHTTYISKVIGNATLMLVGLTAVLVLLFLCNRFFNWNIGEKYNFGQFDIYVLIIAVSSYFTALFSSIFRIYGKLFEIAFSQSIFPIVLLPVILLVSRENLLDYLVYTYLITSLLSNLLFIVRFPVKVHFNLSKRLWWVIQKKGWHLFLYNSSFYLIIISTRSFISNYYTVTEFGYFTFSFSLANVILMLLTAFTFLIWPKLLNSLSQLSAEKSFALIKKIRSLYVSTSHLLVHLGIFLFPYFLLFFPQYRGTFEAFALIALTIVLYTNCFGYQGLLIARQKEKTVGYLSMSALALNLVLCYLLTAVFEVGFEKVILATMVSYVLYVFIMGVLGRKVLQIRFDLKECLVDIFPPAIMIPVVLSIVLLVFHVNPYAFFIPMVLYILLNYKEYYPLKETITELLVKPEKINF